MSTRPLVLLSTLLVFLSLHRVEGSSDPIKKVYIVFSNHLDIGYTKNVNGSTSGAVINQYFNEHFPKAINTANEARVKGGHQYRWMTQSWLVSTFRNCKDTKVNIHGPNYPNDLQCPNASSVAAFEAAVKRKDQQWHRVRVLIPARSAGFVSRTWHQQHHLIDVGPQ